MLFYLVLLLAEFGGITIAYSVLAGATAFVWYFIAQRLSNIRVATIMILVAVPLLTNRTEIRPEMISYLFFGLFLLILMYFRERKLSYHWSLVFLMVLQLMWVNMHVFFVFGFLAVGIFLAEAVIRKERRMIRKLTIVLISVIGVSLINPFGIRGLIEPFTILREYGYMIVENQSVFFIQKRFGGFVYGYFELSLFLLGMLWLALGIGDVKKIKKIIRKENTIALFILSVVMSIFALKYIRVIPLFGYVFVISSSFVLSRLIHTFKIKDEYLNYTLGGLLFLIVWIGIGFKTVYSPLYGNRFGVGLVQGANTSAEFFKQQAIKGPIFNNYDIGGYLIYHLYPKERVFVDNRPEAYSVSFFKEQYIAGQEQESEWKRLDKQYSYNAIYFYRLDQTPWAQPFLIRRIRDPDWIAVYVDELTIILLKNNDQNLRIIEKFALPDEIFKIN